MAKKGRINLLTMRQYLFLKWLNQRHNGSPCNTDHTTISCFNCLEKQDLCSAGVIPASFFSKKTSRQYFDTKHVLDSLVKMHFIEELDISARDFHRYYKISPQGINHLHKFETYFWLD